jgi:tripeptide aminopeptidase
MPLLTDEQVARFHRLLRVQTVSGRTEAMIAHMALELADAGCVVTERDGQLIARKGNSPDPVPFYVAHADTVFAIIPDDEFVVLRWKETDPSLRQNTYWYAYNSRTNAHTGIGGDDKCGLFVCLEAARELDDVGVVITIDEEVGCVGANMLKKADFENAAVLIQADRYGWQDAVAMASGTMLSSPEWRGFIQPDIDLFQYKWYYSGLMTDVECIKSSYISDVSAINISAGYYKPHTPQEHICEEDLEAAMAFAIQIGRKSSGRRWPFTPVAYRPREHQAITRRQGENHFRGIGSWTWDDDAIDAEYVVLDDHDLSEVPKTLDTVYGLVERDSWSDDDIPKASALAASEGDAAANPYTSWDDDDDWDGTDPDAIHANARLDDFEDEDDWIGQHGGVVCCAPDCEELKTRLDNFNGLWLCAIHYMELAEIEAREIGWVRHESDGYCDVTDCDRGASVNGLCRNHAALYELANGGDPDAPQC